MTRRRPNRVCLISAWQASSQSSEGKDGNDGSLDGGIIVMLGSCRSLGVDSWKVLHPVFEVNQTAKVRLVITKEDKGRADD